MRYNFMFSQISAAAPLSRMRILVHFVDSFCVPLFQVRWTVVDFSRSIVTVNVNQKKL